MYPEILVSVSATTRSPRPGEIDGVHYRFVSDDEFSRLIDEGQMLEWATVHGQHLYGTPRTEVDRARDANRPLLLEIDLAGARQVRQSLPGALQVFLSPPSWDELVERLRGRGTEDEHERSRRLDTARTELAASGEFDEIVINDEVEKAAHRLAALMGLADPVGT